MNAGLAQLELISCSALEALPPSLGDMTGLTRLDCQGCAALRSLPDSIAELGELRILNLTDCQRLAALPAGINTMTHLQALCTEGCSSLARPPQAAVWTADMYCRQLEARFSLPAAAAGGSDGVGSSGGKAAADPGSALQPSELTLMCLSILR